MDSGRPFRITRPEDGRQNRTPARTAASRPSEPAPAVEKSATPPVQVTSSSSAASTDKTKTTASPRPKRSTKKLRNVLLSIGLIIVIGAGGFFVLPLLSKGTAIPNTGEYQAVTLTDGQIYFGKVKAAGRDFIEIDEGYYLQPTASTGTEGSQPDTGKLVKLSNRLYSPSGNIVIPVAQVVSFETLDPDGQIVQMMGKQ